MQGWRSPVYRKKTPEIIDRIEVLLKHDTAGDPVTGLKWTHKTTAKIAVELKGTGINVSANTVARLLKQMDFHLRVNHKKLTSQNHSHSPGDRDKQFQYIHEIRDAFERNGYPVISVDTKKKEMIGNFKNIGQSWQRDPILTNDHDFRSEAIGMAVPYGLYDVVQNKGFVCIGTSSDTPAFAVDCLNLWWRLQGLNYYDGSDQLLILADCGGSNSARSRVWKWAMQYLLCNRYGLKVTVCHYPPGSSKWNPIEHRLFSEISKNFNGKPLDSFETILKYTRTTKTKTGLKVNARLITKKYRLGQTVSDQEMSTLLLKRHSLFPNWNYTLDPMQM